MEPGRTPGPGDDHCAHGSRNMPEVLVALGSCENSRLILLSENWRFTSRDDDDVDDHAYSGSRGVLAQSQ